MTVANLIAFTYADADTFTDAHRPKGAWQLDLVTESGHRECLLPSAVCHGQGFALVIATKPS